MKIFSRRASLKCVCFSVFLLIIFTFNVSAQIRSSVTVQVGKSDEPVSRARTVEASPLNIKTKSNAAMKPFELEKIAFSLLNQKRSENNLTPLKWSDDVAKIARLHSENMAKYKFFNHRGLDGLMVDERADALGVTKWRSIGENIAFNRGFENPVEFAVERWMLSPSHRENILNDRWQESAVGVAIADDGAVYFTQVFLLRK